MHRFVPLTLCLVLLAGLSVPADELKGKVKSVAADKNLLTVQVGKKDHTLTIDKDTRFVTGAGKPLPDGLKTKVLQPGSLVIVTTDKDSVKEVKLTDPFPPSGYLDAAEAGPDFLIQGDYAGTIAGKGKLAVQVIAQSESQFAVLFLRGGLPGAGWDGQAPDRGTARTDAGKTALAGSSWTGVLADGKCVGKTPDGDDFTLTRVLRKSSTEGAKPPTGAIVLFDGTNADEWVGGKVLEEKVLNAGVKTKRNVQDFQLHLEFRLPFRDRSQGNSGVYMQERYEIQVMNSYGKFPPPNNGMASIYTRTPPSVNMCYPPLSWQTLDIDFQAARWDAAGKKTANAVVTVRHNGVTVHDRAEIKDKTGAGKEEGPQPLPIYLQNHGSPVTYRNVWLVVPPQS